MVIRPFVKLDQDVISIQFPLRENHSMSREVNVNDTSIHFSPCEKHSVSVN